MGFQPRVQGFYFLELPVAGGTPEEVHKHFLAAQKVIEAHPAFLYAEPSLQAQVKFTPQHADLAETVEYLKNVNLPATIRYLTDQDKLPQKQIVVAVLDSGIDFNHPQLKDRFWKNPGESDEPNGEDTDGNGYIDDIYGVDATRTGGDPNAPLEAYITNQSQGTEAQGNGKSCPNFDRTCGHGTHVGGIIAADPGAAESQDKSTPFGVCQNCKLFSIRIVQRKCANGGALADCPIDQVIDDQIKDDAQIEALTYIESLAYALGEVPFQIINMSIGKYFWNRNIEQLVSALSSQGVLLVAAAGNADTDSKSYPAAYPKVLSVCATSSSKTRAEELGQVARGEYAKGDFSNFGVWVDLCAPGSNISSTFPGDTVVSHSGTSQAAPLVAGAAGVLWAVMAREEPNTLITGDLVKARLLKYSNGKVLYDEKMNALYSGEYDTGHAFYLLGAGQLDLYNAVSKKTESGMPLNGAEEGAAQSRVGCVVSTVGAKQPWAQIPFSFPFLLLGFFLFMTVRRKLKQRGPH